MSTHGTEARNAPKMKAAAEMKSRVEEIIGFGSDQIWVSTFHSTCVRILRRHIDQLGYDNNFTIYDSDDQKSVMKEVCKRLELDTKQFKERTLLGIISAAKDELISPEEFALKAMGDYKQQKMAEPIRLKTHTEVIEHYQVLQPVTVYKPVGTEVKRYIVPAKTCDKCSF